MRPIGLMFFQYGVTDVHPFLSLKWPSFRALLSFLILTYFNPASLQLPEGHVWAFGHCKDFGLYSERNKEPLQGEGNYVKFN